MDKALVALNDYIKNLVKQQRYKKMKTAAAFGEAFISRQDVMRSSKKAKPVKLSKEDKEMQEKEKMITKKMTRITDQFLDSGSPLKRGRKIKNKKSKLSSDSLKTE